MIEGVEIESLEFTDAGFDLEATAKEESRKAA